MRVLAIILFAACGSRDAETPSAAESPSNESEQTQAASDEQPETPVDPGPVPVVDLEIMDDEELSLRLRVPGPDAIELRRSVRVERARGDAWEPVDASFSLRADCEEPAGTCLTLAAGAELLPPGIGESGQCGGAELTPGRYRFVVQSCAPDNTLPHELHSTFTLSP